jgi:hypothetical protein
MPQAAEKRRPKLTGCAVPNGVDLNALPENTTRL